MTKLSAIFDIIPCAATVWCLSVGESRLFFLGENASLVFLSFNFCGKWQREKRTENTENSEYEVGCFIPNVKQEVFLLLLWAHHYEFATQSWLYYFLVSKLMLALLGAPFISRVLFFFVGFSIHLIVWNHSCRCLFGFSIKLTSIWIFRFSEHTHTHYTLQCSNNVLLI